MWSPETPVLGANYIETIELYDKYRSLVTKSIFY